MQLERLREDMMAGARDNGDVVAVKPVRPGELSNAAVVVPTDTGWIIYHDKSIPEPSLSLGLAHEFAHLLLLYRGLVSPKDRFFDDLDESLVAAICNTISHRDVVEVLREEYEIESTSFLQALEDDLAGLIDCAVNPAGLSSDELIGTGASLFDTGRSIPRLASEIERMLGANVDVRTGYLMAASRLDGVSFRQGKDEQFAAISNFLVDCGVRSPQVSA